MGSSESLEALVNERKAAAEKAQEEAVCRVADELRAGFRRGDRCTDVEVPPRIEFVEVTRILDAALDRVELGRYVERWLWDDDTLVTVLWQTEL